MAKHKLFEAKAREIDELLRKNGIMEVRKRDITGQFELTHESKSPIWYWLTQLGWAETWTSLKRLK